MRAVFLYGPPGVGKLSVGHELEALTGFKLIHNHLTVNLVSALFPYRSPQWQALIRQIRREVYASAASEGLDLINTGVYAGTTEATEVWRTILQPVTEFGGTVLYVQLTCDRDELLRRVQLDSREAYGKLTDASVLAARLEREDLFAPLPFEPKLKVDTTHQSPAAVARHIAEHFDLQAAGPGV